MNEEERIIEHIVQSEGCDVLPLTNHTTGGRGTPRSPRYAAWKEWCEKHV